MSVDYDIIIIGAGVMGSASAFSLSKLNKNILLLDQFPLLHTNGSSHGQTRIIRRTYTEKHFSELAKAAFELWKNFENHINQELIVNTGGLDFGPENSANLNKTIEICNQLNLPYSEFNNREINSRYPGLNLPDNYKGIVQDESGVILAEKALKSFQQEAINGKVKINDNEPVKGIKISGGDIYVQTSRKDYSCDKLIITGGLWTNSLLKSTGIQIDYNIWKLSFAYWKTNRPDLFDPTRFPIFIAWEEQPYYGFPLIDRKSELKIAPHFTLDANISLEDYDKSPDRRLLSKIENFIQKNFSHVDRQSIDAQTCFYSMTKDENFILDFHPDNSNIIIGSGFSGHGFKFAPLIGDILSNLAINQKTSYDISQFSLTNKLKRN